MRKKQIKSDSSNTLKINHTIYTSIEIIIGNNLLWYGINHLFGNVHKKQTVNDWNNPVKSWVSKLLILTKTFYQTSLCGSNYSNSSEENKYCTGDDDIKN